MPDICHILKDGVALGLISREIKEHVVDKRMCASAKQK